MSGMRLVLLIGGMFLLLLGAQYVLWFKKDGINDYLALKHQLAHQEALNMALKKENEDLFMLIKRLQNSQDITEEHARDELGMTKKDEVFYQVIK